ncbi:hypothetical protein DMB42_11695 [Nonomuraea sp. WAC 01424]|uniref:DUF4326 domain-containing protein n=1 Tax=Nonomuraea sp. WAC 01424 TaxID=2203200 RepID=UPI000F77904C|nr:DUF4326 domain-containing protein [Nonomuraea sp. WAC 01424]RSN12834.1 hypothetical protein DMB42_11695 [Nonomuraea sp. WAC 01424]
MAETREPKRIQRRRTKGFRLPEGAVCVDRSTRWGNPIRITPERSERDGRRMYRVHGSPMDHHGGPSYIDIETARYFAAKFFKWDLLNGRYGNAYPSLEEIRRELAGKDLACWCPEGPCHADVLLEIADGAYADA